MKYFRVLWIIPAIYPSALVTMIVLFNHPIMPQFNQLLINLIIPVLYLVITAVFIIAMMLYGLNRSLLLFTVLLPCVVSPFFIMGHWVMSSSHMGIGSGGIEYFWSWLTRYPNFGPVNYEIALGILCVLSSHIIPFIYAAIRLVFGKTNIWLFTLFFFTELIFYIPVLVRLDLFSFSAVISGLLPILFYSGPLFRFLSCVSMTMLYTLDLTSITNQKTRLA
jgi:hypothetical protein